MQSKEFEEAFGNFLEQPAYDDAESGLFALARAAFLAGWQAAGGTPPIPRPVFQLLPPNKPKET